MSRPTNECRVLGRGLETYRIRRGVLLLRADDATASLGSVQSGLASDDSLALRAARPADLAADLGDGIPALRHVGWLWGGCGAVKLGTGSMKQGELLQRTAGVGRRIRSLGRRLCSRCGVAVEMFCAVGGGDIYGGWWHVVGTESTGGT